MIQVLPALVALLQLCTAQQIGPTPEVHPQLQTYKCTAKHGCIPQKASIVLDALSHPIHEKGNTTNPCTADGSNGLNPALCSTAESCAENCVLDGADYMSHGIRTKGDSLTLHQYMNISGGITPVSPRVYLLDPSGQNYESLQLLNQELSFDVDVSSLPCGMNGALYLSEMLTTGGRSDFNPAGAAYGTGYCDAQCPSLPWIDGVANLDSGGACCNEMDLWEANALATAYTPHACNISRVFECVGDECGSAGVCDKSGCGFNPYALGARDYYGFRRSVDTSRRLTVVTQFVTDDGTASGTLTEIRRLYVQEGEVVQNAVVEVAGMEVDSITGEYCAESASYFQEMGGLKQMGKALGRGMVLVFSIWNDSGAFMNWLDSGNAGPCNSTEGNPQLIQVQHPETSVTFSKIRWGDIGSTYSQG